MRESIAQLAVNIVCEQLYTEPENVCRRSKQPSCVRARDLALWLMKAGGEWSLGETGREFERAGGWWLDHTSVMSALARAEKRYSHAERLDLLRELQARMKGQAA